MRKLPGCDAGEASDPDGLRCFLVQLRSTVMILKQQNCMMDVQFCMPPGSSNPLYGAAVRACEIRPAPSSVRLPGASPVR